MMSHLVNVSCNISMDISTKALIILSDECETIAKKFGHNAIVGVDAHAATKMLDVNERGYTEVKSVKVNQFQYEGKRVYSDVNDEQEFCCVVKYLN